jgi:hypothetical protein
LSSLTAVRNGRDKLYNFHKGAQIRATIPLCSRPFLYRPRSSSKPNIIRPEVLALQLPLIAIGANDSNIQETSRHLILSSQCARNDRTRVRLPPRSRQDMVIQIECRRNQNRNVGKAEEVRTHRRTKRLN